MGKTVSVTPRQNRYQLAFLTPGIKPSPAMLRKQMRQIPNLRYTARARPHSLQRRLIRIRSRGSILTLSGVRLLVSSFSICLRNLTFCASVVIDPFHTRMKQDAVRCFFLLADVQPTTHSAVRVAASSR